MSIVRDWYVRTIEAIREFSDVPLTFTSLPLPPPPLSLASVPNSHDSSHACIADPDHHPRRVPSRRVGLALVGLPLRERRHGHPHLCPLPLSRSFTSPSLLTLLVHPSYPSCALDHAFNPDDIASSTPKCDHNKMIVAENIACGYGSMLRHRPSLSRHNLVP